MSLINSIHVSTIKKKRRRPLNRQMGKYKSQKRSFQLIRTTFHLLLANSIFKTRLLYDLTTARLILLGTTSYKYANIE